jgi:hypothetical protein
LVHPKVVIRPYISTNIGPLRGLIQEAFITIVCCLLKVSDLLSRENVSALHAAGAFEWG